LRHSFENTLEHQRPFEKGYSLINFSQFFKTGPRENEIGLDPVAGERKNFPKNKQSQNQKKIGKHAWRKRQNFGRKLNVSNRRDKKGGTNSRRWWTKTLGQSDDNLMVSGLLDPERMESLFGRNASIDAANSL
jgi:hypothetical protein